MDKHRRKRKKCCVETENCILHVDKGGQTDYGNFIALSEDRYNSLVSTKTKRLRQSSCEKRQQSVCDSIPNEYSAGLGYHYKCYVSFTKNSERLKCGDGDMGESKTARPSRKKVENQYIFGPNCIFCKKPGRITIAKGKDKGKKEDTSMFEFGGGKNIKDKAKKVNDTELLREIDGYDLFACEAKYHRSCERRYLSKTSANWRSENPGNIF